MCELERLLRPDDGIDRLRLGRSDDGIDGGLGDGWDKRTNLSIKCLHSHYAHYRSQVAKRGLDETDININIVGRYTHLVLQEEFPDFIL